MGNTKVEPIDNNTELSAENGEPLVKKRGIDLSKNMIILILVVSVLYLLVISLLSGLVFRKINVCDDPSAQGGNTTPTTIRTTQSTASTSMSSSSSSSPSSSTTSTTTSTDTSTNTTTTSTTTTTTTTTTSTTTPTTTTTTSTSSPTTTTSSTTTTTSTSTTTTTTTTTTTSSTTTTTSTSTTTTTTTPRTLPPTTTQSTTLKPPPDPAIFENTRLPDIYDPYNYNLRMNIMFDATTWDPYQPTSDGEVDIYFNLKANVQELVFHASKDFLKISEPIVITKLDTNEIINVASTQHKPVKNDYHYIGLDRTLIAGAYKLSVKFSSVSLLFDTFGNRGMFGINYLDNLIQRSMVTTAFLPNEARKVFPCFDEPQLKATFDISIKHTMRSEALSNAPILNKEEFPESNYIITTFKTTLKMSTYLVGWVVVPFNYPSSYLFNETMSLFGKPIRVYSKSYGPSNDLLSHALNAARIATDFLQIYLNISEAVPDKIDIVAIPDFPYEAMETWGLVLMRETSVFYSEKNDPVSTKHNVAFEVAQEMAHMWFGNLVTCKWWDEMWFNLGLATYFKYKIFDDLIPEWEIKNDFIIEETIPAMWDDSFSSSHPLQVNVTTDDDFLSIYDKITIGKTVAVLKMIESTVGELQFYNGIKNYLLSNLFGVGVISDFYNNLTLPVEMSSTTPEQFFLSWTRQMNYPKIQVTLSRTDNITVFSFFQERFVLPSYTDEEPIYTSPYDYKWQFLIKCKAGGTYNADGDETQHLEGTVDDIIVFIDDIRSSVVKFGRLYTWILCNSKFESYYTVEYLNPIPEGLIAVFDYSHETFTPADRACFLHNLYQSAYNYEISYSLPATLSTYLAYREKSYLPWKVFTYHINKLANLLEHRPVFKQLSFFAENIAESLLLDLDIYQEQEVTDYKPDSKYLLESTILDFLCRLQEENCLSKMSEYFSKLDDSYFLNPNDNENPIPANIRGAVYKYHLQNTYNYNDWYNVYEMYELIGDPQEKHDAIIALTYTRLVWALNAVFSDAITTTRYVKRQDVFTVLDYISKNPSGRHVAWYFYRREYDTLTNLFTLSDIGFAQSIKYITETFESIYLLDEMLDFFYSHPYAGAAYQSRRQAIDIAINNIFWIFNREEDIINNLIDPLSKSK